MLSLFRKPTPYTDAPAWALSQRKMQTEKKLRAEGYSRKQAVTMASMMYDKRGGKVNGH